MKGYVEFEAKIIRETKRGLLDKNEALLKISGYLRAMVDMGILSEERVSDEFRITAKKILQIK